MKNSPAVAISAGLWYNINEESAVWQTVSTFPISQLQEMIARVEPGSHFLLLKILYAISNAPKPTVASNVSKAKVSKSVIEHPKVYSCKQYYSPAVAISAGLWYNITKESAVWQTVSTFPVDQQKMIARLVAGRSFFVMKNLIRYVECAEAHCCKQREQSQNL